MDDAQERAATELCNNTRTMKNMRQCKCVRNNNAVQTGQVEATLENHRKMLLRLENSRRQDARDNNLVVEIGPKEQTLRAALNAAGMPSPKLH